MTVKRLTVSEFSGAFEQLWTRVPERAEVPNPRYFIENWSDLMERSVGVAYATFDEGIPTGILCGLITPDLHTGQIQGIEYLWAGKNTTALLPEFEKECRERKCTRIIFGLNSRVIGDRAPALRRFYRGKGFTPYTESFSKELV